MKNKICGICNNEKPLNEFYKDSSKKCGYRYCCKSCASKLAVNHEKRKHPDYTKNIILKTTYGISLDDYNEMFIQQNGCCKICGNHQSEFERGFAVDHDHITGKVRGLLCHKCNMGLGCFNDNIETFLEAIKYLKEFNSNISDELSPIVSKILKV